jgi:hypothetical protein
METNLKIKGIAASLRHQLLFLHTIFLVFPSIITDMLAHADLEQNLNIAKAPLRGTAPHP